MKTPSYPSGHSIQGIFIAKVLSKMYPKHKKQLMEIGKMVSNSRLMARAHYPSDTKLGEKIGELLFLNLKKILTSTLVLPSTNIYYYEKTPLEKSKK